MPQHPVVNGMDEAVGVQLPVRLWGHGQLVPRASFQPGSPALERDEAKLTAPGPDARVQMRRVHVAKRAPFLHGRRLKRYVEREAARRIPIRDRLHEGSRRKFTMAQRTYAFALD